MKNYKKYITVFMAFLLIFTLGENIATAKDEKVTKEVIEEHHKTIEQNKEDIIVQGYDCPMCGSNTRTYKVSTTERYVDVAVNPPGHTPGTYKQYEVTSRYQMECLNSSSCGFKTDFDVFEDYKYVRV
ncbi:hypothetical protein KQI42_06415 [Tissierella sp. MSJ-40]|uniref:Uncharacterized protein n=1 Tax=Tissierella simiarum TaxID=2841534 RepID=A0ABS6E408_9FIRM|nr:hypothetical protein [Tissierella simiarum]MBU5437632.1 hypothetical protein [Tissierella simiarum]